MAYTYFVCMNDEQICSDRENKGIINPIINKEINSAGSFTFTVLPSHPKWNEFQRYTKFIDVYCCGLPIFNGRIVSVTIDMFKQKNVECEGALAFFMDTMLTGKTSYNIRDQIMTVISEHNNCLRSLDYDDQFPVPGFVYNFTKPDQYKRCFILGKCEPEGSLNLVPAYSWELGYLGRDHNNNLIPIQGDPPEGYTSLWVSQRVYIQSSSTYTMTIDDIRYGLASENSGKNIVIYVICLDRTYVGTVSIPLSSFTSSNRYQYVFTYSTLQLATSDYAYIQVVIPKDMHYEGVNVWIQEEETAGRSYMSGERYNQTTDIEVTGDAIQTLFFNNRSSMVRTRGRGAMVYGQVHWDTPYTEDYIGNNIDILNPYRCLEHLPSNKTIKFGVNLIEINRDSPDFEPVTHIRPLRDGKYIYATNEAGANVPLELAVDGGYAFSVYSGDYPKVIKTLEVGANASVETATERVGWYAKTILSEIPINMTVKAIDTNIYLDSVPVDIDELNSLIDVGDAVTVVSEPHNIEITKICLAMKLDIMNPQNNEYTIGDYIPDGDNFEAETLTKKFAKEKKKKKK